MESRRCRREELGLKLLVDSHLSSQRRELASERTYCLIRKEEGWPNRRFAKGSQDPAAISVGLGITPDLAQCCGVAPALRQREESRLASVITRPAASYGLSHLLERLVQGRSPSWTGREAAVLNLAAPLREALPCQALSSRC